jgi:hypothetical protein
VIPLWGIPLLFIAAMCLYGVWEAGYDSGRRAERERIKRVARRRESHLRASSVRDGRNVGRRAL